jgi:hypothetical protein
MARFFGVIGFAEENVETPPDSGNFKDIVVEKYYQGDIVRNSRRFQDGVTIVDQLSLDNSISILANAYANEHIDAMRYVVWKGVRWEIESVEDQRPRFILRLGGVYNGPTPGASESP